MIIQHGKPKILKNQLQEILICTTTGFFKFNFEEKVSIFAILEMHIVNNLLSYNIIISSTFPWNETTLERTNNTIKQRPNSIDQNLRHNLQHCTN